MKNPERLETFFAVGACDYLQECKVRRYGVVYAGRNDMIGTRRKVGHVGPGEPTIDPRDRKEFVLAVKIAEFINANEDELRRALNAKQRARGAK